jgi:hypothetical protein
MIPGFGAGLVIPDLWQQEAVRALQQGKDVVVQAPTGSGKTFSRTKARPSITLSAAGFASHFSREFSISIIPRRTNRARSSATQSPHGRGPLSSECSTPSGTRCTRH